MDIILDILRNIVVEYDIHIINIDTPCCNIRCNQNIDGSGPEACHNAIALLLLHISVESFHKVSARLHTAHEIINRSLRIAEHERKFGVVHIKSAAKRFKLVALSDFNISLFDLRDRKFLAGDLHELRIMLEPSGNVQNRLRHSSRKQNRLPVLRSITEDILDIITESHIEHLISFVQNEHADRVKVKGPAFDVINHTTRSTDDNLHTAFEGTKLALDRLSAVNRDYIESFFVFHQPGELLGRLYCKFPCRRQN